MTPRNRWVSSPWPWYPAVLLPAWKSLTWLKIPLRPGHGLWGRVSAVGKIIRTVGGKIFKMHPVHGFAADLNSAVVIFSATLLHLPVSTTHVVSGSIMGVGSAQRVKAVHWSVARQMVTAWVMTIPCTAVMGALSYFILQHLFF